MLAIVLWLATAFAYVSPVETAVDTVDTMTAGEECEQW